MKLLRHLSLASLLLFAPALAGERPALEKPVSIRRVDGELVIDAKGVPVSFTPAKEVPGSLGTRIPAMVAALRFEPVVRDGEPRVARMPARLTLAAETLEDGRYRVALENLTFPEHCGCRSQGVRFITERRPGLRFPESRIGLDADVLVALRFGLDGRVEDAAVQQSALIGLKGEPGRIASALADFEKASLESSRKWRVRVEVAPGVTPTAEDLSVLVVHHYRTEGNYEADPATWIYQVRTVKRPAPWLPAARNTTGVADVQGGGLVPTSAPTRALSGLGAAAP